MTLTNSLRRVALGICLTLPTAALMTGCQPATEQASDTLVTSVEHSKVKRQSIGNCWIYAQATWMESLILSSSSEEVDVSETYWTWWHWYRQVVGSSRTEIQTGGWWHESARILNNHGWVTEEEFVATGI